MYKRQLQTQVTANKTASDALRKYVGTYPPIEGVDTVVEYVDHKTQEAISKASYDDTGVQAGIQANKLAIEAVNDPANGILALAKADAASKASKALTDAKTYTDTLRDGADVYKRQSAGSLKPTRKNTFLPNIQVLSVPQM